MASSDAKNEDPDDVIWTPGFPAIPTAVLEAKNISRSELDYFWQRHVNYSTQSTFPNGSTDHHLMAGVSAGDISTTIMTDTPLEEQPMCEDLSEFSIEYGEVHGYICLVICIFGAIANLLNIIVLTRKDMNGSPINRILTGMAVADITLIIEYLPFLVHQDLWPSEEASVQYSWGWAAYLWFHANFSIVIHNVSIWLTLTVAVWRFIMIKYHTLVPVYCTMERCHFVLISAYVGPVVLTIPSYFTFTIAQHTGEVNITMADPDEAMRANLPNVWTDPTNMTWTTTNITKYYMHFSDLAKERDNLLFRLTIWLYSFILKFIPSIVLTVFTGFLIHALYKAEERSARLKNGRGGQKNTPATGVTAAAAATRAADPQPPSPNQEEEAGGKVTTSMQTNNMRVVVNNNGNVVATTLNHMRSIRRKSTCAGTNGKPSSRKKSTDRTTRLLIVILVLFLLTEFPQAILGMLSAIKMDFFKHCYLPLGDLMDDIALLNSSINFVIYYLMSRQFRKTFLQTFGLTWCKCPTAARANKNADRNYHELRPLIAERPKEPLQPRPPQVIINAHLYVQNNDHAMPAESANMANEDMPHAAPPAEATTTEAANFVLKRTTDPEERI